jgi:hypothetical protein
MPRRMKDLEKKKHLLEKSSFTVLKKNLYSEFILCSHPSRIILKEKINMNVCNNINVINTLSSKLRLYLCQGRAYEMCNILISNGINSYNSVNKPKAHNKSTKKKHKLVWLLFKYQITSKSIINLCNFYMVI